MNTGSSRLLVFDLILVAGFALVSLIAAWSLWRLRRGRDRRVTALAVASAAGLLMLLVLHGATIIRVLGGTRRARYPNLPTPVLLAAFLITAVVTLAAFDGVSRWAQSLTRNVPRPRWLRDATVPLVIVVGLVGVILGLTALNPPPTEPPPQSPDATRPSRIDLSPSEPDSDLPDLRLMAITEPGSLMFPTFLTSPPDDQRLFVLERMGRVRVIEDGVLRTDPVIDITEKVGPGSDGGLIGLAFHPDFARNGRVFVHYTDLDDDNRVVEYTVEPSTAVLTDPEPVELLHIAKPPLGLHAGGMLQFGPDGYLYVAIGDPNPSQAQDPESLRGILRLDVDGAKPYAIPPENAFGDRPPNETFAYGLRNPYRFWIDAETNRMVIGDVGEATWEEIDVAPLETPGLDFGWNIAEGTQCFELDHGFIDHCDRTGLTDPLLEYRNVRANPPDVEGGGCAVILGATYRGSESPDLTGLTFYADFCSSWIGGFDVESGQVTQTAMWVPEEGFTLGTPISFGVDSRGELYLLTSADGMVYRLEQGEDR